MPRAQRLNQAGVMHHVISRGNANQVLFRDEDDYFKYLSLLGEGIRQHPLFLYNYVLLPSYLHLLVETKQDGALSKTMEMVTREYAKYFNIKYNSMGHVFLGRFKSFVVQAGEYYFGCSKYIDLNPVREGLVKEPKDYRWSGYRQLALGERGEIILDEHELYRALGAGLKERQLVYRTLVQQNFGAKLHLDDRKSGILGSREFKRMVKVGGNEKSIGK